MKLGLIARGDDGGLGNMTWEFFRHLTPDRTLVIDLGARGRGPTHPERFPGAVVNAGMDHEIDESLIRRFCDGLDVVYSAETFYRDSFTAIARSVGCATVLHAMPELFRRDHAAPDAVWVPTPWQLRRMPAETLVIPVPVARDRSAFRQRDRAVTFLHPAAPAFHDRNGRRAFVDALAEVESPITAILAGGDKPPPIRTETVTVDWRPEPTVDYWALYAEADVLVLPRRYAGLSLPMQEALSSGMALIASDLSPQNHWRPFPGHLVRATVSHEVRMVGGSFPVHNVAPIALARAIDALASDPDGVVASSQRADRIAESLDWADWASEYRSRLEWVAERRGHPLAG